MNKYKIPKVNLSIKDPCKNKTKDLSLKTYQIIPSIHFKKYNSLLLYHSVGSGKTATAINLIKKYYTSYNIVLFIKAALHKTWLQELELWKFKKPQDLYFYHYDSINGYNEFINDKRKFKYSKTFYIIDEAHNFINNVYSNNRLNKEEGIGRQIYEYIYKDMKKASNVKLLLISATPIVNEPYETSIMFNLLRPGCLYDIKTLFNKEFIKEENDKLLINNKLEYQNSIKNLVSYYYGAIPNQYAISKIKKVYIMMSDYQEKIYLYYHLNELKDPNNWDFYKIFSRQASNFVFPNISKSINGYSRPRPSKYGGETPEFAADINNHLNSFEKYLDNLNNLDIKNKHTLNDDLHKASNNFNNIVNLIQHNKSSRLLAALYNSSAKFLSIILRILKSKGPVIVYTNFTLVEGIAIMMIYLKYFGFVKYSNKTSKDTKYNNKRFVEYHGMVPHNLRDYYRDEFNKPDNIKGNLIKIFFVSSAGSEGITLYNIRQIHITEPHWNEVRFQQINGRGIRLCSHKNLPVGERNVAIYRYLSIDNYDIKHKIPSTDQFLLDKSTKKEQINNQFLQAIKEISIDCELNYEHTKFDMNNKGLVCKK